MGTEGIDRQQQKVSEFMRLLPLTVEIAGLSRAEAGRHLNEARWKRTSPPSAPPTNSPGNSFWKLSSSSQRSTRSPRAQAEPGHELPGRLCLPSRLFFPRVGQLGNLQIGQKSDSIESKKGRYADAENDGDRSHRFLEVDLGGSGPAILKDDGGLTELAARLAATIEHFLLEGIAARTQVF